MLVADANVVIAVSSPRHIHHERAKAIVLEHGGAGIVLHSLTFAEVLVGPARSGHEALASDRLIAAGFSLSTAGEPDPSRLARIRAHSTLKMPDVCVVAMAQHLGCDLASFDTRLVREAKAWGVGVLEACDSQ